ncbi:DotH/IcmK family type IV secretion protein [Gammaproteobacteria bacterium]|nr:DotH/IcmK family type IV secretion protein [Gammaproteobacteria bacterium]
MNRIFLRLTLSFIFLLFFLTCNVSFAVINLQKEVPPTMAEYQEWLKNNGHKKNINLKRSHNVLNRTVSKQKELVIPAYPDDIFDEGPIIDSPPIPFKKNRDVMIRSAPPSPVSGASKENNEAFNIMLKRNVPLTPRQVVRLRQLIDTSQRAAAIPANIPPKPVSSTVMVNLAPGATPPAIRLSQGYITSLVFVDSTGSPWPIASYDIGDPKKINPQWDKKSNILLIQAISPYGDSDLIIRLVGLPTPVTLQLVSGQRVVDYRTDIHVPGLGPNSKDAPTGTGLPGNANQLLLNVLDGIPPSGSKQLNVTGGDCLAWLLGDKMYLRTRFTVLSPGWIGRMVSPDGMHAYEIQQSSSVLISKYGSPTELKIEGF